MKTMKKVNRFIAIWKQRYYCAVKEAESKKPSNYSKLALFLSQQRCGKVDLFKKRVESYLVLGDDFMF